MQKEEEVQNDVVVTTTTTEFTTRGEIEKRRENGLIKELKGQINTLVKDYELLMNNYESALQLLEPTKDIKIDLDLSMKSGRKELAVPIIQYSDWHVEERIEKRVTHGLNEYNPDIATRRVKQLTENTLKLIKKERHDSEIKEMVVCLGGDFINNFLHEHDKEMNFMSPVEATMFAKELLKMSLQGLLDKSGMEKIHLVCIRGNHGRLTKRMQSSNDYKMNLEAVLYHSLRQELNDSRFIWSIPDSEHGYVDVYGKVIRCFHGHQVQYQGGVGEVTVPLNKAVMKWDKTKKADWNLMHHFHSYWMPTRNTSLNGSLCGWNSYALSKGFGYEPPLQVFHLLDSKRGFTVRVPIHCEK